MKRHMLAVSLFALCACDGKAESEPTTADQATGEADSSKPVSPTSGESGDTNDSASSGAASKTASQETPDGEIPARFHGVWDAPDGSCSPGSEGYINVGAKKVQFNGFTGTVTSVIQETDAALVEFDMVDEEESWQTTHEFVLINGQLKNLTPGAEFGIYDRARCP